MAGLDWKNYLDPSHYKVPLHALNYSCQRRLALYLNKEPDVMHDGLVPNFGGLAELIGFDSLEIENFERSENPGRNVLSEWKNSHDKDPTVGRLMEFFCRLGREDILTDCHKAIQSDVLLFIDRPNRFAAGGPIQDETVSQGPGFEEIPTFISVSDVNNRTVTQFDAFVCYNPKGEASKDIEFVMELVRKFEAPPSNMKLFIPCRDDLPGLNEHKINAKIISERCRHMIVVLSKNFHESEACDFQTSFAVSLSPSARNNRIIPVKIEDCPIPNVLKIIACCDFTKKDLQLQAWSWKRLSDAVERSLSSSDYQLTNSPTSDFSSSLFLPPTTPSQLSSPSSTGAATTDDRREGRPLSDADLGYISSHSPNNRNPDSERSNVTAPVLSDPKPTGQCSKFTEPMEVDSSPRPQHKTVPIARRKAESPSSPSLDSLNLKKKADMTSKKSKAKEGTKFATSMF